jgi:hypothetical protein
MKFRASLVASFLALTQICPGQQAKAPGEDIIAECGALVVKLREKADKARSGVETAISQRAKAGVLKTSTEAYYRDVLARFRPVANGLPAADGLYYPPRFDTSAEMEPINLAWDELRLAMEQIEKEVTGQREKIGRALGEAVEQAARTAEKPEDLEPARKLQTALAQLPEGSRITRSAFALPPSESFGRVLTSMNSALDALGRKDYAAMALALQRVSGSYGGSESRISGVPFNVDSVWTVFRERLAAVPRTAALHAERAVEKALQAKKPEAECERLITELDARMQEVERLLLDSSNRMSGTSLRSDTRTQLLTSFRAVVRINAVISGEVDETGEYRSNPTPVVEGPFAMSPEFRTYLSGLATQRTAAQKAARDRAEKARQEESARAQAKQQQEQAALQQKMVAEAEARLKAAREKISQQLHAASKPQELLAVADSIPTLISQGENRYSERQEGWHGLQAELRQLAAWWADPVAYGEAGQAVFDRSTSVAFAVELRELRERAMRQIFAERFKAPEMVKPPLSELAPRAAAEKLAEQAGQKGEWLRAYEILRVLSSPMRYGGESSISIERLTSIKAYLVGRNMEQAGQYREAVLSYRQVLTQLGENLPIKEAGERLQVLQKEHPEAMAETPKPKL